VIGQPDRLVTFSQITNATDRRTDGHTDSRQTLRITNAFTTLCYGIANPSMTIRGVEGCHKPKFGPDPLKTVAVHKEQKTDWHTHRQVRFYIIHCVSKNGTTLACYNFDVHRPTLMIFVRKLLTNKQSNGTLFSHIT